MKRREFITDLRGQASIDADDPERKWLGLSNDGEIA
jgi:hypothetical protein